MIIADMVPDGHVALPLPCGPPPDGGMSALYIVEGDVAIASQ